MTSTEADPRSGLRATALVCSLKPSPEPSSSELLARQVLDALGVPGELVRVADHDVKPGIATDMGDGDEWPPIREKLLGSDILVFATPTWAGHPSSIAQRVLERLDAELSETDDQGRPSMYGKAALVAVVGNEDGAHKIIADVLQALNDIGFTIAANASTYWNSEAMNPRDYRELGETPEAVAATTKQAAANTVHLVSPLKQRPYPGKS